MDMSDSDTKKFEETLIRRLVQCCCQNKATKDPGKEHVVLMDNKRVEINGKSVWSTEAFAQKAIQRLIDGRDWYLNNANILFHSTSNQNIHSLGLEKIAAPMRQKWVSKHLRVMPLREYMVFEHNRAMSKK